MCMELSKQELQAGIIGLEVRLHDLQRNAEIHNRYDEVLPATRELLTKFRNELASRSNEYDNRIK